MRDYKVHADISFKHSFTEGEVRKILGYAPSIDLTDNDWAEAGYTWFYEKLAELGSGIDSFDAEDVEIEEY